MSIRMSVPPKGRSKMFFQMLLFVFSFHSWSPVDCRVIQKRAAFYLANETMCIVDGDIYRNGDPVPTDDECERCTCRPPGFSCVLRDCDTKPGCKAVRKVGECCPEYVCGCVHNSRLYEDGELIRDLQNNCYTCRCHGSSISCTFADCLFRGDCPPEYFPGECCPNYEHCPPMSSTTTTSTTTTPIIQEEIEFFNLTTQHLQKFSSEGTTVTVLDISASESHITTPSSLPQETLFTVKFTLSGEKISSLQEIDTTELTTILPRQTVSYKDTTRYFATSPGVELTSLKLDLAVDGFETTTHASSTSVETYSTDFTSKSSSVAISEPTTQYLATSEVDELSNTSDTEDKTDSKNGINTIQDVETSSFSDDFEITTGAFKEDTQSILTTSEQVLNETAHEQETQSENASSTAGHTIVDSNKDITHVFSVTQEDITSSTVHLLVTESSEEIPSNVHIDSEVSTTVQDRDTISDRTTSVRIDGDATPETSIQDQDNLQESSHEIHTVTTTVKETWIDTDSLHSNLNVTESENPTVSQLYMSTEDADISQQTSDSFEPETDLNSTSTITPTVNTTEQKVYEIKILTTNNSVKSGQTTETTQSSYNILDSDNATDKINNGENFTSENYTFEENDLNSVDQETESGYDSQTIKTLPENYDPTENLNFQNSSTDLHESVKIDEISGIPFHSTETTFEHLFSQVTTENSSITDHDVQFVTNEHTSDNDLDELDYSVVDDNSSSQHTGSAVIAVSTITDEHSYEDHRLPSISDENELFSKYATTADTTSEMIHTISADSSEKNAVSQAADSIDDGKIGADDESTDLELQETQHFHENGITETERSSTENETAETEFSITTSKTESVNLYHETGGESSFTTLDLSDTKKASTAVPFISMSPGENIIDPNVNSSDENNESHTELENSFAVPTEETTLEELDDKSSLTESAQNLGYKQTSTNDVTQQTISELITKINEAGHYDSHDSNKYSVAGADEENLNATNFESDLADFQESEITTHVNSQSNTFGNDEITHLNDSANLNLDIDNITTESLASTFHYEDKHSEFQEKEKSQNSVGNATDILNTSSESSVTTVGELLATTLVERDELYGSSQRGTDSTKVFSTDVSFNPYSNETKNVTEDIDTLHVKDDTKTDIISVTSTLSSPVAITSLKTSTEKSSTSHDLDIPIEISEFEPPMANILKQQMLFNRPVTQKENISQSSESDNLKDEQNNLTNNSSDASHIVRLSLTLAEENNESAISNDSKNDIFVLNHEYTISDSEVNDLEVLESHESDKYNADNEDHSYFVNVETTFSDKSTTINYSEPPTSTADKPIHVSGENEESISFTSNDEILESEKNQNATAESRKSTPESAKIPILHSDAIESYAASPNSIDIQIVKDILELNTTNDSQENANGISALETSDNTRRTSIIDDTNNKETNSETDLLVGTSTEKIDMTRSQTEASESLESHDYIGIYKTSNRFQSSNISENSSTIMIDANDDVNKISESSESVFSSQNEDIINRLNTFSDKVTEEMQQTDIVSTENEESHFITHYDLNEDHNLDVLPENYNETDIDFSYHDAESEGNLEEDLNTPQEIAVNNLDPEMITALHNISTSLMTNATGNLNESLEIRDEQEHSSTASTDVRNDDYSTIKINVMFGQNAPDTHQGHEILEKGESVSYNEGDSNTTVQLTHQKNVFPSRDTEKINLDELPTEFAELVNQENTPIPNEISETNSLNSSTIKTNQNVEEDIKFSVSSTIFDDLEKINTEENSFQNIKTLETINSDELISPDSSVLHTDKNSVPTISSTLSDTEEFDTTFTTAEYIGDLFSRITTFLTASESNDDISMQSEAEISNIGDNSQNIIELDSSTEDDNPTPHSEQSYSSLFKNLHKETGITGSEPVLVLHNRTEMGTNIDAATSTTEIIQNEKTTDSQLDQSKISGENLKAGSEIIEHRVESFAKTESPNDIDKTAKDSTILLVSETVEESTSANDFTRKQLENDEMLNVMLTSTTSEDKFEQSSETQQLNAESSDTKLTTSPDIETENNLGEEYYFFPTNLSEDQENENVQSSSHADESILSPTESSEVRGPEKGGDVFEPSFPAIFPVSSAESGAIDNNYDNASDKNESNTVTSEIFENQGTEKSGDVFEPSSSDISNLNSVHFEVHDNISDSVTISSVSEFSALINDTTTTKFSSSTPKNLVSVNKIQHKSEFVPPLPILLKGLGKTDGESLDDLNGKTENSNIHLGSNLDITQENDDTTSKDDDARSFYHPFPLSDIISEVFKAPGYDSEIHLSPWRRINPLTKSQILRRKRSESQSYEDRERIKEEYSHFHPLSNNPARSSSEDNDPVNKKNALLVEGYGYKPSGFLPVTSSFIIVHSDEDTKDNEAVDDFRQKKATTKSEESTLRKEFQNEISTKSPLETIDSSTDHTGK